MTLPSGSNPCSIETVGILCWSCQKAMVWGHKKKRCHYHSIQSYLRGLSLISDMLTISDIYRYLISDTLRFIQFISYDLLFVQFLLVTAMSPAKTSCRRLATTCDATCPVVEPNSLRRRSWSMGMSPGVAKSGDQPINYFLRGNTSCNVGPPSYKMVYKPHEL